MVYDGGEQSSQATILKVSNPLEKRSRAFVIVSGNLHGVHVRIKV